MIYTTVGRNLLAEALITAVGDGQLVLYGSLDYSAASELVAIPLPYGIFSQPTAGQASLINPLLPVTIGQSGDAVTAELLTRDGSTVATMRVRSVDDPNAERGDLILDRTDLQRGGRFELSRFDLTVPQA